MSTSAEGRVLVSTHNLQRAGELKSAFEEASYTVDLVTPDEDVSGDAPVELLVITGAARSRSAVNLREQARNLSQAPSFAIVDDSESALHLGADYLEVFSIDARADEVVFVARSVIERRRLQALAGIVGETDAMREVLERVVQFAPVSSTVLITGESGTGKELVAEAIHQLGSRRTGPFVAINMAAIPHDLLESELFGHEKGAFTGAIKMTEGKIELADGGTLFLDEVGDIPLALQVKLLRFLQERTIERIGGRKPIPVDTRIVCATHQNLEAMIAEGTFREDLFYRLAEIVVKVPTLAERAGDAVLLAKHFLARFANEMNPQVKGFAPDALTAVDSWDWPGNVRELENRVKRAVIMADAKLVSAEDLDLAQTDQDGADIALNLKAAREQADRRMIRQALARSEGNISNTAKLLGISRPTLYDLLKQYDLQA